MIEDFEIETTTNSNLYGNSFLVPNSLSKPPFPLLDLDYNFKSFDSSKISHAVSTEFNFDVSKESKFEILMSVFPGIREMTEKEAEDYEEFLEAYFE